MPPEDFLFPLLLPSFLFKGQKGIEKNNNTQIKQIDVLQAYLDCYVEEGCARKHPRNDVRSVCVVLRSYEIC